MTTYSFSQIGLYEQCPKKYQFKYLDKYESEFVASYDTVLWNSVHSTLEWLYKEVNVFRIPTEEDVLAKFREIWDSNVAKEWEIQAKWTDTVDVYLERWRAYLEEYYEKYAPFDWTKVIWTELQLTFKVLKEWEEWEWRSFRWFVDRLDKQWEDVFIINDYKTNKYLPPEDNDHYREQLTLYALWVKQKYWKYIKSIKARLFYLHFNIIDEWEITDDLLEPIIEKYSKFVDEIEKKKAQYENNPDDKNIFPTLWNKFCQYCEFQNVCPLFTHLNFPDEKLDGWDLWETTVKRLVDRFYKLGKDAWEIKKEKDMIREMLIEYADAKWFEQLFWEEDQVKVSKWINYSIKDKEAIKQYAINNWMFTEVWEVNKTKFVEKVKNWEISEEDTKALLDEKDSYTVSASKRKDLPKEEE